MKFKNVETLQFGIYKFNYAILFKIIFWEFRENLEEINKSKFINLKKKMKIW